ncbi:MAG: sulfite exporter TauE/SafE family protein [Phreatobacter sp.]|nr:sulfite exporter TauE/SafE family protein [Phreatobacter sp.]
MSASSLTFFAGMLMGFASSLHCAGMCGSIGSALMLTVHPDGDARQRARMLLVTQFGRVLAYAVAGGILGTFGSGIAGAFDQTAAYRVLQWASAVTLGWIGLSTAGLIPSLVAFDRLAAPVGHAMMTMTSRHPGFGVGGPMALGIIWGFMPCAMVYGALFTAMLAGTGAGGAALMLGFGLGTVPAVMASAMGVATLKSLGRNPAASMAVGLAITAFAVASVLIGPEGGILCLPALR